MEGTVWQDEGGECVAVLRCVFATLAAAELWRCCRVCRAWRDVALDDALWRRAICHQLSPRVLRAFTAAAHNDNENHESLRWSWRREYLLSAARWRRRAALPARGPLLHAALHTATRRLALLAEDSTLTIWEECGGEWREAWAYSEQSRGWRRAEAARWAASGASILLAGPLTLADRWELAVLQRQEDATWHVVCRADAGASGGACWAGHAAFLSLRPQLLAPGLAITTVWLNAVSQETNSEYSGVTTPLLRIFNESAAHISHMLMTEMPSFPIDVPVDEELVVSSEADADCGPRPEYYTAISAINDPQNDANHILVAAIGAAGGTRGEAQALGAWRVPASTLVPPLLLAGTGLAERVRARRLRDLLPQEEEPPPPTEPAVRALCTAPDDVCVLGDQVLGLVLHPRHDTVNSCVGCECEVIFTYLSRGSCIWASTAKGATCVTLPTLRRVQRVALAGAGAPTAHPHYISPDVDDDYFFTPTGGGSGTVEVFAARSGRRGTALRHAAPAIAALLVPPRPAAAEPAAEPASLLVLTTDTVLVWERSPLPCDE